MTAKAGPGSRTEVHPPANGSRNYVNVVHLPAAETVGSPHPPVTAGTVVHPTAGTVVHPPVYAGTVVHPPVTPGPLAGGPLAGPQSVPVHPGPAARTVEEPGPYVAADPGPIDRRRRRLL